MWRLHDTKMVLPWYYPQLQFSFPFYPGPSHQDPDPRVPSEPFPLSVSLPVLSLPILSLQLREDFFADDSSGVDVAVLAMSGSFQPPGPAIFTMVSW